eukprot:15354078-Ditylum_brightwellii.AAC.1
MFHFDGGNDHASHPSNDESTGVDDNIRTTGVDEEIDELVNTTGVEATLTDDDGSLNSKRDNEDNESTENKPMLSKLFKQAKEE